MRLVVWPTVGPVEVYGLQAGSPWREDVEFVEVADVQRGTGMDAELGTHREVGRRVWLGSAEFFGGEDRAGPPPEPDGIQFRGLLFDGPVGEHRRLESGVVQRVQGGVDVR